MISFKIEMHSESALSLALNSADNYNKNIIRIIKKIIINNNLYLISTYLVSKALNNVFIVSET